MTIRNNCSSNLGDYTGSVNAALSRIDRDRVVERIWARDHTVWKPSPEEITNRLGWLDIAATMFDEIPRMEALTEAVRADGYTQALLCGMGGSSLASEVFRKAFGVKDGYLDLAVLDSTDPGAVLAHAEWLDLERALFIVSSKSGGTVETVSLFNYFYNRVAAAVGAAHAGAHFVAITDPGSALVDLAGKYRFRDIFLNDPHIGGRYSALSFFGLVPAALIGVNLGLLLDRAISAASRSTPSVPIEKNRAAWLGAVMGALAEEGRNKLTIVTSPQLVSFGEWIQQLVAESTGKEGRGILPVVGEMPGPPDVYGGDRLFAHLRSDGGDADDDSMRLLEESGFPVVRLFLSDINDLGAQFFLWEMATAVAGSLLGINPFDQPNVDASKERARAVLRDYEAKGELPVETPVLVEGEISIYGEPHLFLRKDAANISPGEALVDLVALARPGAYVAIQAYLQPTDETGSALQALRTEIRDRSRLAVTVDYGPRYLHSTGQLHKGDGGDGLFVQITADDPCELSIPDQAGSSRSFISFGVLEAAQAIGDRRALSEAGRRVIRFHLGNDAAGGLRKIGEAFS